MKKFFIIFGIIIGFILLALVLVPVIFKDDIRAAVDSALEESLNADFVFDTEDFSVSLFKHFPNPSASLKNFGVINRAPFEGEVLFAARELEAVVNLGSLIFGDQMKIKGVVLNEPTAFLKVLEDGTANYDIAVAEELPEGTVDTASVSYNIGIEDWQINDGEIVYEDLSIPFKMTLTNLNHQGSGDFTQDVIDMQTYSIADSVSVTFDNVEYVSNKVAEIDMGLRISENYERYDFLENSVRINDFALDFAGWLRMLADGSMDMDITFNSTDNSFKNLLSIVPGMYHDEFEELETEGQLSFEGMAKGVLDSLRIPAFNITLNVDDASFKYPEVEESFRDITLDLNIQNPGDSVENTRVALNNFHMNMGGKPIDASLIIENLINYPMDASLKGSIDFETINQVVPIEGMTLRGLLDVDITANGFYDSIRQVMPKIDGRLAFTNGYIKSADFPAALDQFNVQATANNTSGDFKDFVMEVSQFNFLMDGEPFTGQMTVSNLENINWHLVAKGNIDLEKMAQVMSLEDMELSGQLAADINTRGNMEALEAERYDQLPTSGSAFLTNFKYTDTELPYQIALSEANASFNPQRMELQKASGTIGNSDFNISGYVSNYMGYIFNDNEVLKGNFNFQSNNLDLNEFMTEEEETPNIEDESEMGVIEIPDNVDVVLNANVKKVTMLDMEMNNMTGNVTARDGIASMNDLMFNLLDGRFAVNGSYDPTDLREPKYNFDLDISELSVQQAFQKFDVVKNFAPIAESIQGKFSTDFNLSGLLTQEMTPDLTTINGEGIISLLQAALTDSKIVEGITNITKLNDADEISLNDIKLNASFQDGKLVIQPFDVKILGYTTVIAGSTGIDGSIEYIVELKVPAQQAAQAVNQFSGLNINKETVVLPVSVTGTFTNPKFGLRTEALKDELADAAKDKATEEIKEEARDALDNVIKDDKVKDALGGLLGNKKDTTNQVDTTKQEDSGEKLEEKAKETIRDFLNRKKKGGGNN